MVATKPWTLDELHRLPDDGNKYELVRGELFVTPLPNEEHEIIAARLTDILAPYVKRHALGVVFHPRAVFRFEGSEVEPDLMVRQPKQPGTQDWTDAPIPLLIVEILSPSTRRRDRQQKRSFYVDSPISEYWMADPEAKTITRVRAGAPDETVRDRLIWAPPGASDALTIDVADLFGFL